MALGISQFSNLASFNLLTRKEGRVIWTLKRAFKGELTQKGWDQEVSFFQGYI